MKILIRTHLVAVVMLAGLLLPGVVHGQETNDAERGERGRSGRAAVLSIVPSSAEPGMVVKLYGSGFSPGTRAWLGNVETQTSVESSQELSFRIPDLHPGQYALFLRRGTEVVSRVYNFSIQPKTPVIDSLVPDHVFVCGDAGIREVAVTGGNFSRGSQVLLDGAVIKSRFLSPEEMVVAIPPVAGGMHSVQVRNPGGTASSPMSVFVDSKPVITSVSQGDDFVNYYELVIEGNNFFSNSTVIVDGKSMTPASVNRFDREKVRFVDCRRIVYERHPYDKIVKTFSVQVVNPNGEESEVTQVSAP